MKGWRDLKQFVLNSHLATKKMLLGLDYDGTLSPLVQRSAMAHHSPKTRQLLLQLAEKPNVQLAIITGRSLEDITSRLHLKGACYAGNHGLEIRDLDGFWRHPRAAESISDLKKISRALAPILKNYPRARLEDKLLTVTVHYRGMKASDALRLYDVLARLVRPYKNRLVLRHGKKNWELHPGVNWNKGHAILKMERSMGERELIFIGDDRTDEEGFRLLGKRALTIRVGPVKKSHAQYVLRHRKFVDSFLELLGGISLSIKI